MIIWLLVQSFPGLTVEFQGEESKTQLDPKKDKVSPPFRIRFEPAADASAKEKVVAIPYMPPAPGPYPEDRPKSNGVPFTPVQVGLCALFYNHPA